MQEQERLPVCLVLSVCLSERLALAPDKCQHKAWYLLPRSARRCEDSLSVCFLFFSHPRPFLPTFFFSQPASISSPFLSPFPLSIFLLFSCFSSFLPSNSSLFLASPSTSSSFFFCVRPRHDYISTGVHAGCVRACVRVCVCVCNRGVVTA